MARLPRHVRYQVLERDNFLCRFCGAGGKHSDIILEAHHVVWRRHGGLDDLSNLICICRRCHFVLHYGYCPANIPLTFSELKNQGGG